MNLQEEIIVFVRETIGLAPSVELELIPLSSRGSERSYFRLKWAHAHSAILMQYNPSRIENTYFADIASFLREINIPVPEIMRHDQDKCLILMQDLGDTDLWSLKKESWQTLKPLYLDTLDIAHRLHSFADCSSVPSRIKLMEPFGLALYRWERDYFQDNFVRRLCSINLDLWPRQALERELDCLAQRLESVRKCLVHRDLQSQNVLIYQASPFLIDFQGLRLGNPLYDLASLLCDPYMNFTQSQRQELLSYYYGLSKQDLDWPHFQTAFWEASAQRLMQALGAYAFLALTKGLKNYLIHVPSGLKNLALAADNAGSLPRLRELCTVCETGLQNFSCEQ